MEDLKAPWYFAGSSTRREGDVYRVNATFVYRATGEHYCISYVLPDYTTETDFLARVEIVNSHRHPSVFAGLMLPTSRAKSSEVAA